MAKAGEVPRKYFTPEPTAVRTEAGPTPQEQEEVPSQKEIAQRAYELFLARGAGQGQEVDDWLQAEAELREKYGKSGRN